MNFQKLYSEEVEKRNAAEASCLAKVGVEKHQASTPGLFLCLYSDNQIREKLCILKEHREHQGRHKTGVPFTISFITSWSTSGKTGII